MRPPTVSARRVLIAASPHEVHDIVGPAGEYLHQLVEPGQPQGFAEPPTYAGSAPQAADLWDQARSDQEPFDVVVAVLDPGGTPEAIHHFDVSVPDLASGVGLFHWIRHHGGDQTRLIAVVNSHTIWGPDALFALASSAWLRASVLDRAWTGSNGSMRLIPPPALSEAEVGETDDGDDLTAVNEQRRSNIVWWTLQQIERHKYRGSGSKPLGNALAWLRLICQTEYNPTALSRLAQSGGSTMLAKPGGSPGRGAVGRIVRRIVVPASLTIPTAPQTIKKRLVETFNAFIAVAETFTGESAWEDLDANQMSERFWDAPKTRAARHFIDLAFSFLVFEDIDRPWMEFSASWSPNQSEEVGGGVIASPVGPRESGRRLSRSTCGANWSA